ncbi:MAG TPA: hypothetical protein VFJ76_10535 [Solirubrobacterales bacterium]|nr:hypothetical protein [Solirubrobacterales bacterium]
MKHLKHPFLGVLAALLLIATFGASPASADDICTTNTTPCSAPITTFQSSASGSSVLETLEGTTLATCASKNNKGTIKKIGSAIMIILSIIDWFECTRTVTTLKTGSFEINWTSGTQGSVVGRETEITVNGIFGTSCVYGTGAGTTMGTISGTTLTFNAKVPRTASNFLCPSEARYTGVEKITNHSAVFIHNS